MHIYLFFSNHSTTNRIVEIMTNPKDPFLGFLDKLLIQPDFNTSTTCEVDKHFTALQCKFEKRQSHYHQVLTQISVENNLVSILVDFLDFQFDKSSILTHYEALTVIPEHERPIQYVIDMFDITDQETRDEFEYIVLRDIFRVFDWHQQVCDSNIRIDTNTRIDLNTRIDPITMEKIPDDDLIVFRQWNAKQLTFLPLYRSALAMKQYLYSFEQSLTCFALDDAVTTIKDLIIRIPWTSSIVRTLSQWKLSQGQEKEFIEWCLKSDKQFKDNKYKQIEIDAEMSRRVLRQEAAAHNRDIFANMILRALPRHGNRNPNAIARGDPLFFQVVFLPPQHNNELRIRDFGNSNRNHED